MNYRNISYGILAYYWIAIGMFTMNLPTILPDNAISFLTAGCVGWLWRDHSQRDSDIATARSRSPRLLTLLGDFSWDGVTDIRTIHGRKYAIMYGNGVNYDGWYERGDVAICVPSDQVMQIGQNVLVATDMKRGSIPPNVIFDGDVRVVLTGNLPSQIFDKVTCDHNLDTISAERDAAVDYAALMFQLNQDILNGVADSKHIFDMITKDRGTIDITDVKRIKQIVAEEEDEA